MKVEGLTVQSEKCTWRIQQTASIGISCLKNNAFGSVIVGHVDVQTQGETILPK